jgi:phospholipase/carboxylesterase
MTLLPCVEIEPTSAADSAVIWLHGLGADGHDFEPVVPQLRLPVGAAVRFIFPHAPAIPITINGGMVMPAWYDITDISLGRKVDTEQLMASARALHLLIDREIERGIPSNRIVIAGFSQGGAVAYQGALTYPRPLAGLATMSSYFATANTIQLNSANAKLPTHVFHGSQDPMVPEQQGHEACQILTAMGYQPGYDTYPIEHSVCIEEIADIATCLRRWLTLPEA